ncbi:acyl-CoA dehydrogenase family protein [Jatrophihabitans endophyticus]|uniref:acyl-CoA dehydrogenase family protein n=1 Tax=Jatrophihabitans endophyticus TaxID=1206085 RepID=UPI001A0D69AE|nr:acyl-CoA dehydrogenase family protein [Jatrophihabitans endophyticus]MBE7186843.1 acyl-CoA dehydrogenase family protein [Jatrophihabitans endophyticus]
MSDALDRLDLLDLDDDLDGDDRLLRDTVRKFADDRLRPNIRQWFEDGTLPARELAQEFGALGVLGMHLEGYGCAGAKASQYGLACAEIEAVDSGLRSLVSVQGSLAMFCIWKYGSEDQKQQWLPGMAKGELLGCFGLTEPDAGSDPAGMRTRAVRDGDDWVLNGSKMWITNGSLADVAVVWARTDDGVRGFLVEKGTKGFTTQDVHHKISLRASVTSELVLDDVRVPESSRLPEGLGLKAPLGALSEARYGIVWGVTGAARDALASALDYAGERTQFDKPIAGFQLTQKKFADLAVALQHTQLTAARIGALKDAGRVRPHHISFGKFSNVRTALEICREARSILGGSGITTEYPVLRHAVNLETVYTYEGTHEVHTLVLGSKLTGLDAFR